MTPFEFEPAPLAGKLTREETLAAYERHLLSKGAYAGGDWEKMGHIYAEDATYHDAFYGWIHGREAITLWLYESMIGLEEWSYPVQWKVVDEGRVVVHWLNRLPGKRPDGTHYEFPGCSCITFNDNGQVIRQVDIYDCIEAIEITLEHRMGPFGRFMRRLIKSIGPLFRESTRWFYRVLGKKPTKKP